MPGSSAETTTNPHPAAAPPAADVLTLPVAGMTGAAGVHDVGAALRAVAGVAGVSVSLAAGQATVQFDAAGGAPRPQVADLSAALAAAGYSVPPARAVYPVSGMTCAACVHHVTGAIGAVPGVSGVSVNLASATAAVTHLPGAVTPDALAAAVADAGYHLDTVNIADHDADAAAAARRNPRAAEEKQLRIRLVVAMLAAAALLLGSFPALPWTPALLSLWWYPLALWAVATPVQLWAGWPFYTAGWAGLRRRQPNMHTLIALGTSVAYGYSVVIVILGLMGRASPLHDGLHFDMAAVIVALILLGRWLETRALSRASDAIGQLLDLRPPVAHLVADDGAITETPVARVRVDDRLAVRPGERIPVDGVVVSGTTTVDESALTGESRPVDKAAGDALSAGALNGNGGITMRATRVGADTTLAQIIRLVEEAQGSAAPAQRLADRVAARFVPAVGVIALAAALLWLFLGPEPPARYAMMTLVAVFIIACPCALGLATPTAIIVGVGRAARRGILIRNAAALETAHRVTLVAVDKTGTLTAGRPQVTEIVPAPGVSEGEALLWAASAEQLSEHPVGQAVVRRAQDAGAALLRASDFTAHRGAGVTATVNARSIAVGNAALMDANAIPPAPELSAAASRLAAGGATPLFVAVDGRMLGVIAAADTVQPHAPAAVAALHSLGVAVVMLTGDRPEVAAAVAAACGIDECHAGMLPADKSHAIARRQAAGHRVAMVGDGINDAPALAQADVGIAMGAGSDIARATADITLMRNDLTAVATALRLSRATMRTIRQNLFWAFFYNALLIPVAAGALYPVFAAAGGVPPGLGFFFGEAGFLNPILAALAMAFSSVSVVGNSLRLRRARLPEPLSQ